MTQSAKDLGNKAFSRLGTDPNGPRLIQHHISHQQASEGTPSQPQQEAQHDTHHTALHNQLKSIKSMPHQPNHIGRQKRTPGRLLLRVANDAAQPRQEQLVMRILLDRGA